MQVQSCRWVLYKDSIRRETRKKFPHSHFWCLCSQCKPEKNGAFFFTVILEISFAKIAIKRKIPESEKFETDLLAICYENACHSRREEK
ncbi:hypothetical protein TNIN_413841 [Trichonephila inaurata madagascariensis]|uniref:Uncharacterized protein n=1 Tax=Trichonephila inaurata madagascariensis TaxID=2747483 RepID=A0A8X7BTA1_9ARAC|nr:hypothetical protein TNIN_413841 [Trichonephila inaurata madagascariensis]